MTLGRVGERTERRDPELTARPGTGCSSTRTPTDLAKSSWVAVLKRTIREFKEDELVDRANIAVLLGAEFNAELERGRQIEAGHPADKEPFLEPRDTRKMKN